MRNALLGIAIVGLGCAELPPAATAGTEHEPPAADPEYARVVSRVSEMVQNQDLASRVQRRGLSLVDVTWEDTGRAWGSALGPNISDFTLQVRHRVADRGSDQEDEGGWLAPPEQTAPAPASGPLSWHETLMPVIRYANFTDRTGDVPVDRFLVRVGNASGRGLTSVPLIDVIRDLGGYASSPSSLSGTTGRVPIDLSASRDTHFLVSAQALFLPIPRRGRAEFNPVLFNYQSAPGLPAVLAILATREGTSMTVVENRREDQGVHWGQELYFNDGGQRACFTAERRSDVAQRIAAHGGPRNEAERSMLGRGADVMAIIQVPLVHDNRGLLGGMDLDGEGYGYEFSDDPLSAGSFGPNDAAIRARGLGVERAVLGHGARLGPFVEGHGTPLVRDPMFPIRVTLQFYKATTTGDVSDRDLDAIATSIESAYAHADHVGSLVVPEDDARRPTAWQHVPGEWFPW
jgi:hypothetical protein